MANIKEHLDNIKNALFGKDVRGSIHDGIDAINREVENTTGRQVDLESTFDQLVINAGNSNAEIVDARVKEDGTSYAKLGDRLDSVDSQLETKANELENKKANKDDVRYSTASNPITMSELHTEVKQAMTGGSVAVVGVDTVGIENIKNRSVDENKTSFMNPSKNLFDKSKATVGKFIGTDLGGISSNASYYLSDYIPVLPNEIYTRVQSGARLAFYDNSKTFISVTTLSTFTTPSNCYYIRNSVYTTNFEIEQIELGETRTAYESYKLECNKLKIYNSNVVSISKDKLDFEVVEKELGKNLFNPNTVILNSTLSPATGNISSNVYNNVSDFIKVEQGEYTRNTDSTIAFYDSNKKFISGIAQNNGNKTVTIPLNCAYVRMNVPLNNMSIFQFEKGTTESKYEPYGYRLVDIYTPPNDSKWKNKKWVVLGDSITGIDYAIPTWNQIISNSKDIELHNYGISGTTMAHEPHIGDSSYDESKDRHLFDYGFTKLNATEIGYDRNNSLTWNTGNCMCERYVKMIDDADLVTVMGGTNDYRIPLGVETDTRTDTLYGGYNHLFKGLIEKYPLSTIAIFTPPQTNIDYETNIVNVDQVLNSSDSTKPVSLQLRCEVMKRVARKYGLPVLDLFNSSGFNGVGERSSLLYRDGVHPTNLGQEKLASTIEGFIETI